MNRVLIQAGHSSAFIPYQQNGGGAPGEASWASDLARRLSARLTSRGVDVTLVGCWSLDNSNPPPEARADADLFVSLHFDAAIYGDSNNTGCLAGRASADPQAAAADRFLAIWERTYPAATGIPLRQDRLNPNITDYYAFRVTSSRTPGVLLEHGVGQGLDHDLLFNQLDAVADADADAVLDFLGVAPPGEDEMVLTDDQKAALAKLDALGAGSDSIDKWLSRLGRGAEIGRTIQAMRRPTAKQIAPLADELSHLAD